ESALARAGELLKAAAPAGAGHLATVTPLRPAANWSHERPFPAEVLENQSLSGREFRGTGFRSYGEVTKDVRHLELSLDGSGLAYAPGDALGIRHRNPEPLVAQVLEATRLDGDAVATEGGDSLPLAEWLATRRELTRLSRPFLVALAERSGSAELARLLEPGNAGFAALLADHQLLDVLRRWPADWTAEALLAALRPQVKRLYSIASSRKRVGDEAHLTVDVVRYQAHGHAHVGAASAFLAGLGEGDQLPVYVEPNERFRVPADASRDIIMVGPGTGVARFGSPSSFFAVVGEWVQWQVYVEPIGCYCVPADASRDIIMVGPGTGVAPFRGFVQERAETGAGGRNWLFFGAQHFNTGFL